MKGPGQPCFAPQTPIGLYDPQFERDACGVGFVARPDGKASRHLIDSALSMLHRMDHRGATGRDQRTGDGAGIMLALPDTFLRSVFRRESDLQLPPAGHYATGLFFLSPSPERRHEETTFIEQQAARYSLRVLGWREPPTSSQRAALGEAARRSMPALRMPIIERIEERPVELSTAGHKADAMVIGNESDDGAAFELALFLFRKHISHRLREHNPGFFICSLSTRTLVYKGMLTTDQLALFFDDLRDPELESHFAVVHSRFSTNTFPSWDRAQPNRVIAHNGEINTLRGNVNWMAAREESMLGDGVGQFVSEQSRNLLRDALPVVELGASDSGAFDNVLELLINGGYDLAEAVRLMIPEAWQKNLEIDHQRRDFYRYHSHLMEPWDGPACITFANGRCLGAVLDRNGLRPCRWVTTRDGLVVLASEAGVLDFPPEQIEAKGRLEPGRLFLIDFEEGRVIADHEVFSRLAAQRPYAEWLAQNEIHLKQLRSRGLVAGLDSNTVLARQQAFGYTAETLRFLLRPLVEEQKDPLGSMGEDAALACLSHQPRLLFDYFKQLFAQVTNPPIDSTREDVVMSLQCPIGREANLLDRRPESARRLILEHPILSNEELAALRAFASSGHNGTLPNVSAGLRCCALDATWPLAEGVGGMRQALERVTREAEAAVDGGATVLVLSDRATGAARVPLPSLLICGAVHHHLIRRRKRTRCALLIETAEAREVHHHCTLLGYGADGINPYLAFESLWQAQRDGRFRSLWSPDELVRRYRAGIAQGLLKVMAKMGISTLQSYKGAQIFEALGVGAEVIDLCFVGTPSRIGGVGFEHIAEDTLRRHAFGFPPLPSRTTYQLTNPGHYHWRPGGEHHLWNPATIADLQLAARSGDRGAYERFATHADKSTRIGTLRGLLTLRPVGHGVPLDEVEPATAIVKRFATGAMSFGSLSAESHETLAIAMNRLGGKSNTGEGGEDPARFVPDAHGDSRRSSIKQVASGRFGVTAWYLSNADELQIKMAQGAKPGEGGELPGYKVDEVIARTRYSTPGVGLISPPPHHDIYSIEDLKQLIFDLKNANPNARVSVKLVSEAGVGTVAAGVVKAKADHILISGHDGGTGASPLTSVKHAGLPWELGLAETHQTLVLNGLRSRIVLQTDGQLKTGRDVAIAALLGAEEFAFATAPLISLGCIMMRKCHLNTCPVGIATQDPELRRQFNGAPEHVVNYLFEVAEDLRRHMATLGFRRVEEMVGRTDALEFDPPAELPRAATLDLGALLAPAVRYHENDKVFGSDQKEREPLSQLDHQLIELAEPALRRGQPVRAELPINNVDRAVGTMLSFAVLERRGERALPPGTLHFRFSGSAGQSFGAFLVAGITLELHGDANDGFGKGLSGGRVIVRPPAASRFVAEDNVIAGNVALYGATEGEAFLRGRAAERFAVRNSGARAVVEGVGDHGCEYMTGGRAVILGAIGRNFAAGMSGGIAWLWDPENRSESRCNHTTIELEPVTDAFVGELQELLEQHFELTGSAVATGLLARWPSAITEFVQIMPHDYRRVLQFRESARKEAAA